MEVQYSESGEIEAGAEEAPYLLKNFVSFLYTLKAGCD